MRRMIALLMALGSVAGIAACTGGGGLGGGGVTVVTGGIAYFVVRAPTTGEDTVSVPSGQTVQLRGQALDGTLTPLALIGDTVWTSRSTTVATVDSHGLVRTFAAGSTWVVGSFTPANSQVAYSDSALVISAAPQ